MNRPDAFSLVLKWTPAFREARAGWQEWINETLAVCPDDATAEARFFNLVDEIRGALREQTAALRAYGYDPLAHRFPDPAAVRLPEGVRTWQPFRVELALLVSRQAALARMWEVYRAAAGTCAREGLRAALPVWATAHVEGVAFVFTCLPDARQEGGVALLSAWVNQKLSRGLNSRLAAAVAQEGAVARNAPLEVALWLERTHSALREAPAGVDALAALAGLPGTVARELEGLAPDPHLVTGAPAPGHELPEVADANAVDPAAALMAAEEENAGLNAAMREFLADLSPRERELLELQLEVEDLPQEQAAQRLGVAVNTIGPMRARIRKKAAAHGLSLQRSAA